MDPRRAPLQERRLHHAPGQSGCSRCSRGMAEGAVLGDLCDGAGWGGACGREDVDGGEEEAMSEQDEELAPITSLDEYNLIMDRLALLEDRAERIANRLCSRSASFWRFE